jgi:N-acetylglucosaminyldiphosphoundecaprenol N-acetyl-beta-D-mannosaminyltransferase
MSIKRIVLNGLVYNTADIQEFSIFLSNIIRSGKRTIIVHINLRNYYYMCKNTMLKESIKANCLIVFDGIGMKVGFVLRGLGILPDLNGTDLFPLIMENISNVNLKIFLLGSDENTIKKTAICVSKYYPHINVCGYHHGYFQNSEDSVIVEEINNLQPDLLLIGRGFPLQEEFALRNMNILRVPFIWNVGGLFDSLSGLKPRAPLAFRKIKLEWLYRFIMEPKRMLHRNTVAAFYSLCHIIFNKGN